MYFQNNGNELKDGGEGKLKTLNVPHWYPINLQAQVGWNNAYNHSTYITIWWTLWLTYRYLSQNNIYGKRNPLVAHNNKFQDIGSAI